MRQAMQKIKLVATDLDGTLLTREMGLSHENREALERCITEGITVVVATGRSLSSVPEQVRRIRGLEWLVCANGAKIYDNVTEEQLFSDCLSREAIDAVWDIIEDATVMKEIFYNGVPYTSALAFEHLEDFGVPDHFADYVRATRKPVEDLTAFTREHIDEIENINFIHSSDEEKIPLLHKLAAHRALYTLTTSLPFNFEIGGAGVDKSKAVDFICRKLGIRQDEVMCIGDNNNDVAMIEYAGVGVAVENAVAAAREAADFITTAHDKDGVAFAIEIYCE
jgi:Cof subfamily protein (haloacid dehalogenase superfamily)